jgi:hypothetical protein
MNIEKKKKNPSTYRPIGEMEVRKKEHIFKGDPTTKNVGHVSGITFIRYAQSQNIRKPNHF